MTHYLSITNARIRRLSSPREIGSNAQINFPINLIGSDLGRSPIRLIMNTILRYKLYMQYRNYMQYNAIYMYMQNAV